jgi:dynein heavy chain 1, cytosolic
LNTLLKYERSDIDKKRSNLLRLQGEFRIRIRELEESLLRALSNVKGNILDDDQLIGMLETLKAQVSCRFQISTADKI